MTVQELIYELEQMDADAEVRIAMQPSWPLAAKVVNVTCESDFEADEDADVREAREGRVWIAIDQVGSSEHPYAPRAAWAY